MASSYISKGSWYKGSWYKAATGLARSGTIFPLAVERDCKMAFTKVGDAKHYTHEDDIPNTMLRFQQGAVVDVDRLLVAEIDGVEELMIHLIFDHYESALRLETALTFFGDEQIDRLITFCVSHLEEENRSDGHLEYGLWR